MSVKPHLSTSLSQRLVLTPQMRQRIELLAMTKLELADMVQTELTTNPVLDEVAPGEGVDDNSQLADDLAAVDATTADNNSTPEPSNSAAPPVEASPSEQAPSGETAPTASTTEATPVDGEAEPERERAGPGQVPGSGGRVPGPGSRPHRRGLSLHVDGLGYLPDLEPGGLRLAATAGRIRPGRRGVGRQHGHGHRPRHLC